MQVKIQKWGNSLALRLPKALTEEVCVTKGSIMDLSVSRGKLIVLPLKNQGPSLKLLLKAITPQNRHQEIETGEPIGKEIW